MRIRTVITAAVACLALAGCGNDAPTTSQPAGNQPANPAAPAASQPVPGYRILTKAQLDAALLGLDAMPAGYSEDDSSDTDTDRTFCNYREPHKPKVEVNRVYIKGGGLSSELLNVSLRQYAGPAEAKAAYAAMTKTLKTCRSWTDDGTKFTAKPMNLPSAGEASVGVRMEADGATLLLGYALAGPTLVSTGSAGLMTADANIVGELLGKQVAAYEEASIG